MVVLSARTGGRVKRFSDFFDEDFLLTFAHMANIPVLITFPSVEGNIT
jgi:hypothetical protein